MTGRQRENDRSSLEDGSPWVNPKPIRLIFFEICVATLLLDLLQHFMMTSIRTEIDRRELKWTELSLALGYLLYYGGSLCVSAYVP